MTAVARLSFDLQPVRAGIAHLPPGPGAGIAPDDATVARCRVH